jgi:hypothetical protein
MASWPLLDALPNLEVRLFNPYASRQLRVLGLAGDFARLNRRMHNKSFTADGLATIVGGRNVGDEYFGATGDVLFADLDIMAVGRSGARGGARLRPLLEQCFGLSPGESGGGPVGRGGGRAGAARWPRTAHAGGAALILKRSMLSTFVAQLTQDRSLPLRMGAGPAGERRSRQGAGQVDARDGPGLPLPALVRHARAPGRSGVAVFRAGPGLGRALRRCSHAAA